MSWLKKLKEYWFPININKIEKDFKNFWFGPIDKYDQEDFDDLFEDFFEPVQYNTEKKPRLHLVLDGERNSIEIDGKLYWLTPAEQQVFQETRKDLEDQCKLNKNLK